MDHYELVARSFQQTMEAISLSVDTLAGPLQQASELLTGTLLGDRKVISCSNGTGAVVAQLFATFMANGYARERPGLPALDLSSDAATLSAIAGDHGPAEIFARQIRALGVAGDALLVIDSPGNNLNLLRAVEAAQDCDIPVVALCHDEHSGLPALLHAGDTALFIPGASATQIVEMQVMVIGCLCELIDANLFGNHYSE